MRTMGAWGRGRVGPGEGAWGHRGGVSRLWGFGGPRLTLEHTRGASIPAHTLSWRAESSDLPASCPATFLSLPLGLDPSPTCSV